jgi:hypothetical protein
MIQMMIQVAKNSCDSRRYNERTLEYLQTRRVSQPYPYPSVDCYLITSDELTPGSIVECEPVGLLLQDENGEIDHKILAVLPGQEAALGPELLQELQEFIYAVFAEYPEGQVRVGPILPRDSALNHLLNSGSE